MGDSRQGEQVGGAHEGVSVVSSHAQTPGSSDTKDSFQQEGLCDDFTELVRKFEGVFRTAGSKAFVVIGLATRVFGQRA